jgi:hypothetical protein
MLIPNNEEYAQKLEAQRTRFPGVKVDLDYRNGWNEIPEIVRKCRELGHLAIETGIGNCLHETTCEICGYFYKTDSSG